MEDFSKYNGEGTELRRVQLRMLDIMLTVDKIFRKHNILYMLDGGTLLGAVRHQGFIPWDDDLDISVLDSDMPRIKKVLQEELPDTMCFQDVSTDFNFSMRIAKVRDKRSIFDDPYSKRMKERGIYIDLIPKQKVVNIHLKRLIDFVYIRSFRGIHNFSDRWYEKLIGYICYPFCLCAEWLCKLWVRIVPTKMWGNRYGWPTYSHMKEDDLFPPREILFEGHQLFAPNHPEQILTDYFGDYMQIPPEAKRYTHLAKVTFLD